jgi:hypothetical protein
MFGQSRTVPRWRATTACGREANIDQNSNLLENKGAGSLGGSLCNPSSEAKIATFEVSHPCLTAAVSGT